MHVEGLMPANLCLVTLLSLGQCSLFERFHLQHVEMVNKTSNFKTKLIGNNDEVSSVTRNTLLVFNFPTFYTADFPLEITGRSILA